MTYADYSLLEAPLSLTRLFIGLINAFKFASLGSTQRHNVGRILAKSFAGEKPSVNSTSHCYIAPLSKTLMEDHTRTVGSKPALLDDGKSTIIIIDECYHRTDSSGDLVEGVK